MHSLQSVSSTQNLRKAASLAHLYCDDRRASTVADSEANSSLGILKLDDCPDLEFSQAQGNGNISDLLQKFRKDSLLQSLPEKENCEPNPVSIVTSLVCAMSVCAVHVCVVCLR